MITITPKFDADDPAHRSRIEAGAYVEPIFPVEVRSGKRVTIVWLSPLPGGSAGWHHDVMHREGHWPLDEKAKAALEAWFERFAAERWPDRTQIFPADYRGPTLVAGADDRITTP